MVTTLALKRRPFVERRALALVRGGGGERDIAQSQSSGRRRGAVVLPPALAHCFMELRGLALHHGFIILRPEAPFMGADEHRLLAWLASAQRVFDPCAQAHTEPAFRAAIMRCAGLLGDMGLRFSPLTLCGALNDRALRCFPEKQSCEAGQETMMERRA